MFTRMCATHSHSHFTSEFGLDVSSLPITRSFGWGTPADLRSLVTDPAGFSRTVWIPKFLALNQGPPGAFPRLGTAWEREL